MCTAPCELNETVLSFADWWLLDSWRWSRGNILTSKQSIMSKHNAINDHLRRWTCCIILRSSMGIQRHPKTRLSATQKRFILCFFFLGLQAFWFSTLCVYHVLLLSSCDLWSQIRGMYAVLLCLHRLWQCRDHSVHETCDCLLQDMQSSSSSWQCCFTFSKL